jgi:hypothetical protein
MTIITVGVINPAETEKVTMQVPDDVAVGDLRDAIVDQMGLPPRGQNGRRLQYHLSIRDSDGNLERLNESDTLEENEVGDGGVLQITVEMTAGRIPRWSLLAHETC